MTFIHASILRLGFASYMLLLAGLLSSLEDVCFCFGRIAYEKEKKQECTSNSLIPQAKHLAAQYA